jgi:VIT1/CCC1 family predicted Fe2+/Mn2+ transporter
MEKKMTESIQMPTCPMAEKCKGIMKRPFSGFMIAIPGIFLIVLAVIILVEPRILVWLAAAVLAMMGIATVLFAKFIHGSRRDD